MQIEAWVAQEYFVYFKRAKRRAASKEPPGDEDKFYEVAIK